MMLTRCPGCSTTFRVTPEQVKARQGKVRCGRCQHVFDAIESLVDAAVVPPALPDAAVSSVPIPAAVQPPAPELGAVPAVESALDTEAEAASAPAPVEDKEAPPSPAGPVGPAAPFMPAREDALDVETLPPEPLSTQAAEDLLLQPSPLSSSYAEARPLRQVGWPWTLGATLVFLALIAQVLIAFRVDLAVKYPQSRPLLDMLCEHAACTVELPAAPDLISIESSDLHPGKKGGLELNATLRNRAPHAQAWPHLELTLTDGADKPIVRKVITPEQYLPGTQSVADGFAANDDQAVQLMLDAGALPAAGYRLYLFYP